MRLLILTILFLASFPVGAAPSKRDLERAIDAYVAPYLRHHAFSGVVLVAHGDRVLTAKGYGMANYEFGVPIVPGTRFALASISKMFTRAILTRLYEQKLLTPDDKLSKWVPDFPSADKITIGQLVAHRSGIRDPEKLRRKIPTNLTTAETVAALEVEPLGGVPGETYSYTTANYAVLAHVIELVTGREFADVMQQYVYAPAKMYDSGELTRTTVVPRLATGYMPDPYSEGVAVCGPEDASWKAGGGSSFSTAGDLHRFVQAFYGGRFFAASPREVWPVATVFNRVVGRASGAVPGANAAFLRFLNEDLTVVVLSNNYAVVVPTIAQDVAAIYLGEPYVSPSLPARVDPPPPLDPRIAGVYSLETRPEPFTIAIRNGRPFMSWNSTRQSALIPLGENRWLIPLDWGTLTLERNADGSYEQGSMTAIWADAPLKVTRRKE